MRVTVMPAPATVFLIGLTLLGCGSSGGGGGGGGNLTTFNGAASGNGTVTLVEMTVSTTSFSPPAPVFPTASVVVENVPATVVLRDLAGNPVATLIGNWDEDNNTLDVASGNITMIGGYNVPTNQIGGQIDYGNGTIDQWNALKGKAGTTYCGTWNVIGTDNFALVVSGTAARGYADSQGTPVEGTVSGNSVTFTAGGFLGTATFGASGISGTVNNNAFTGSVC